MDGDQRFPPRLAAEGPDLAGREEIRLPEPNRDPCPKPERHASPRPENRLDSLQMLPIPVDPFAQTLRKPPVAPETELGRRAGTHGNPFPKGGGGVSGQDLAEIP